MARIEEAFQQQFPLMKMTELQDPIIFVVDMINGFIKEGALHDEAIMQIVPALRHILAAEIGRSIFIADAHPPKTREFLSYPAHCIIGTPESEVIAELQPYVHELFHKNSTNTFTADDFQSFLKERLHQYRDIVITGCCTDICIMQFALCLNAWLNEHNCTSQRIIIPLSCVETYHIPQVHDAWRSNQFALQNMAMNGIVLVRGFEGEEAA